MNGNYVIVIIFLVIAFFGWLFWGRDSKEYKILYKWSKKKVRKEKLNQINRREKE